MTVKIDRYTLVILVLAAVTIGLIAVTILSSSGAVNVVGLTLTVVILLGILVASLVLGIG